MSRPKPSSRANGCLSRGPNTEEGKARSRFNALTHGFYAKKNTILDDEPDQIFEEAYQYHLDRFQPQDDVEAEFITDMASTRWRLGRVCATETRLLNQQLENQTSQDPMTRIAGALSALAAKGPAFEMLQRYEDRLHRRYIRSMKALRLLQQDQPPLQSETGTPSEQPAAQLPQPEPCAPENREPADADTAVDQPDPQPPQPEEPAQPLQPSAETTTQPVEPDADSQPAEIVECPQKNEGPNLNLRTLYVKLVPRDEPNAAWNWVPQRQKLAG